MMLWFNDFAGVKLHVGGEHRYDSAFPENVDYPVSFTRSVGNDLYDCSERNRNRLVNPQSKDSSLKLELLAGYHGTPPILLDRQGILSVPRKESMHARPARVKALGLRCTVFVQSELVQASKGSDAC